MCKLIFYSFVFYIGLQEWSSVSAQNRPAASAQCVNKHQHCAFWSSQGECRKNPAWMLRNCAAACKICEPLPQPSSVVIPIPSDQNETSNKLSDDPECPRIQVVEVQTRLVVPSGQYRLNAQNNGCANPAQPNNCSQNLCYHKRYRTADGSCNHLDDPMKGAAQTPFLRLLNANYEDGVNLMVGTTPNTRPEPRALTRFLMFSPKSLPSTVSSMVMGFGQMLIHDILRNTLINSCKCETRGAHCQNIRLVPGDRRPMPCIPFTRFVPMCTSGRPGRPRLAMNENTAYIDASPTYGSDPTTQNQLRVNAFLRTTIFRGQPFPPRAGDGMLTGDDRFDLFAGLTGMHVHLLRFHNNIVFQLQRLNPSWNSERLYQEARKIVGAVMQSITYEQYLPTVLGGKMKLIGEYKGFQSKIDPQISSEFSSAVARWHSMIQDTYPLCDSNFRVVGQYRFIEAAGDTKTLLRSGPDMILRGLIATPGRRMSRMGHSITELLFDGELDMNAVNIQRSRDMGVKPYAAYRKLVGLPDFTFEDWPEVTDPAVRKRVSEMYRSPEEVDLNVGGLLENPTEGSVLGPTFAFLYAEQFKRLRDGDRFYYENEGVFTEAQRNTIKKFTLGKLLCITGDSFTKVQHNVFLTDTTGANAVPCSQLPGLDLSLWRE
ncbi:ShKT domain-containing protein [Aphelenchoides besseyi]|nr:ShKT domain-containing protein [Aphelenchoides besseyi]KAI6211553.1 ShKT domain-containing protein [Aphelenchoides besseyi]